MPIDSCVFLNTYSCATAATVEVMVENGKPSYSINYLTVRFAFQNC